MARWQLTIIDPLNVVPPLVLTDVAEGYSRSIIQQIRPAEFTAAGNPIVEGVSSRGDRFTWEIQVPLSQEDAMHLEALIDEQQHRLSTLGDGVLYFADEIEYVPLKPANRQKSILPGTSITRFGKITGFPVVPAMIVVQSTPKHIGVGQDGYYKLFEFTVIEWPEATPSQTTIGPGGEFFILRGA
jgi:hypothetical protein